MRADMTADHHPGSHPAGPLSGVRVLVLSSVVLGPMATQILGDLGADVIMVENPKGDTCREMGLGPHPELSGIALNLLRNKRNIALDIRSEHGREITLALARRCDVLVTNLRPSTLRRAGLTYEDVAAVRPEIIYCQAQGFPLDSDRADEPAYDDIIQAASGVPDASLRATGRAVPAPTILADKVCALTIVYAITSALFARERTGEGDHIEVPMVDVTRAFVLTEHGAAAISRQPVGPAGYARIMTPNRRPQRTSDGWVHILPYSQAHYEALFLFCGRSDFVGDPRYMTRPARVANADYLYATLHELIAGRTTDEWLEFCRSADIPATRMESLDDLVDALPEGLHPVAGPYKVIPPPVRFAVHPASVRRPAPLIGADTEAILSELEMTDSGTARADRSGTHG
jgi:crotonobetainyl-CoA:carnitine CoA-transferase CaiB-like acyl-CoA transferase